MRVVEFLGPPGSGKTTLSRDLARSLPGVVDLDEAVRTAVRLAGEDGMARTAAKLSRSSGSRLWRAAYARSTDRFWGLARFIESQRPVMETILAAQRARVARDRGQDVVLGWVLNLMARYQLAIESAQADWLVIDEGFCQRGVAVFSYGFAEEDRSVAHLLFGVHAPTRRRGESRHTDSDLSGATRATGVVGAGDRPRCGWRSMPSSTRRGTSDRGDLGSPRDDAHEGDLGRWDYSDFGLITHGHCYVARVTGLASSGEPMSGKLSKQPLGVVADRL